MYVIKVQLPSRGKYGHSHVRLSNPSVDHIRSFLAFKGKSVLAINSFVRAICEEPIDELPVGDRDYIFLNIRNMVNNQPYSGAFDCTSCGHKDNNFSFSPSVIEVKQLPDDFEKDYKLVLPGIDEEVIINSLTVDREESILEYLDLHASADKPMNHTDLGKDLEQFARYAGMLTIGEKTLDQKIEFLRKLDFAAFEIIVLYDVLFDCGPINDLVVECENCKKRFKMHIPIDETLLGISLSTLLTKHRFLSKVSNIGFQDFLKYSVSEMDMVVAKELELKQKSNPKK